jgi:hypothetical protein
MTVPFALPNRNVNSPQLLRPVSRVRHVFIVEHFASGSVPNKEKTPVLILGTKIQVK